MAVTSLLLLRHLRQCPHPLLLQTPAPVTGAGNSVVTVVAVLEEAGPMAVARVKVARDVKAAVVHEAKVAAVKCVVKAAMASVAAKNPWVKRVSMAVAKAKLAQKVRTAVKAATATVAMRPAVRHPLQMWPLWACPLR